MFPFLPAWQPGLETSAVCLSVSPLQVRWVARFCEDDPMASLLLSLHQLGEQERAARLQQFSDMLAESEA